MGDALSFSSKLPDGAPLDESSSEYGVPDPSTPNSSNSSADKRGRDRTALLMVVLVELPFAPRLGGLVEDEDETRRVGGQV